ncbi:hypothetical protein [Nocardioides piscis]|uniref:hypothetical protein n=1 Tax=Nocardioides piscis TaxID=2714938 RepID=UPI001FEC727B|nr:hypothetical protein [Nocardioides piscis]
MPTVVKAVEDSTRIRANRATGWPVTAWLSKLKPDPLKRLHLDLGAAGKQLTGTARTSVPKASGVQRARVDTEVRAFADHLSDDLAQPWATAVRRASTSRLTDLGDRLDRAVASTDLGAERIPVWAGLVRVLQWLLIMAAIVGGLWLALLAFGSYARLPEPPTPEVWGFALPTLLFLGGILLGILLALVCRVLVGLTARRRAAAANKRLRAAIAEVSGELVIEPIETELSAYASMRSALAVALK